MSVDPQITDLCRRVRISDHLTSKGVTLVRAGSKVKCSCPLPTHKDDRTPSFYVSTMPDGTELFKCFGCGQGGNIITLIRLMEGGKNGHIIGRLAKSIGVSLSPFSHPIDIQLDPTNDEVLRAFCDEDAINQEIADYALEAMTIHKGSPDIIDKVSEVYKILDEMAECGDQSEQGERGAELRRKMKSILMGHEG